MRLTIKLKLALAFGAVIVLSAAMAVLGITSLAALNATSEEMLRGPVQRAQLERELQAHLLGLEAAERSMILADTPAHTDQAEHELLDRRQAVAALVSRLEIIGSVKGKQILAFTSTLPRGDSTHTMSPSTMKCLAASTGFIISTSSVTISALFVRRVMAPQL